MVEKVTRPPTLTSTVTDHIREAILRGDLQPGAPLREIELSKSLEISRGTVREALHLLLEEGLVEVEAYRGVSVIRLSPQKAQEIYTLRGLLEGYTVHHALENAAYTAEDFDALQQLIDQFSKFEDLNDIYEILKTDVRFHFLICKQSGHQLIMNVLGNLQSQNMLLILNSKLYQSDLERDDISHQAILDALKKGDPKTGEEIVRKHIHDAGRALVEQMKASQR